MSRERRVLENFLGGRNVVEVEVMVERKSSQGSHLGSAFELAPSLLQATTGHITGTTGHGVGTGICRRAGGRVLATQTSAARVVAVHGIPGTAAADVVDGGGAAHIPFELFVETEDSSFTAAVDVAGTTTAGGESAWGARVQASQGGGARCGSGCSNLGVFEIHNIPRSPTTSVNCSSTSVGDSGMGFHHAVI